MLRAAVVFVSSATALQLNLPARTMPAVERAPVSGVSMAAATALKPITQDDVLACQEGWANAITGISKVYLEDGDYVQAAADAAAELYGYGHTAVLFKPTKAAEVPFRPDGESAMSYFVGGRAVDNGLDEDAGFAINGGKGWKKVVFKNDQVDYSGNVAIAMGTYWFTCATTGEETRVEYTFGYKRCADGKPRIFLHHSSVPYVAGVVTPTGKRAAIKRFFTGK